MRTAARLVQTSLHLLNDADEELRKMLDYPFTSTLASQDISDVLDDDFQGVSFWPAHSLLTESILAHSRFE